MNRPPADRQRRLAIRWLVISVAVLAVMLTFWWLVARTNTEGHHDAQLLPLFTLIPLGIALFHAMRWRLHW